MSERRYEKQSFYTRCQACNLTLDKFQQTKGYCTDCLEIIRDANDPWRFNQQEYDMKNMWRNPLGGDVEIIENCEKTYQGE